MKGEFLIAITQLAAERNLPREVVLEAVEGALVSAFKKDSLAENDLAVRISPTTGDLHVYVRKVAVEGEVEDEALEMGIEEARGLKEDGEVEVGEIIEIEATPTNAGRIAAQTAKQVVMQRLREAERELVYAEYAGKEGEIVSGVVQRLEGRSVIVDIGRAEAILPPQEQAAGERYRNGQRMKVYIVEVGKTPKGPQVVVSRTHKDLLRRLFELEVPEIFNGIVEIKSIAREPGYRSKVAVAALQERVDAVGSCVGLRGMRIQNIVNELHGEKIDVVEWVEDRGGFIAKALGPAQVMKVLLNEEAGIATAVVPERQLSLAIGREGQNARLAAKLTGWRIDIKSTTEAEAEQLGRPAPPPAEIQEREKAAAESAAVAEPEAPSTSSGQAPVAPEPVVAEAAETVAAESAPVAEAPGVEPEAEETVEGVEEVPSTSPEQQAAEVEAPSLKEALAREETWQVPQTAVSRSPIRFAEDIAEYRGGGGRGRGRRGDTAPPQGKKGRKGRAAPSDSPTPPPRE